MDAMNLWLAILGATLATFAIRISFLGPWARNAFPPWLSRALSYAPPVIFAALITPMILKTGLEIPAAQLFARIAAALVTLTWAFWRGGQLIPLIAGMATLHAFTFLAAH
jgi:branched-subunit amino acid transport protein